jgi:hypothetical protein
MRFAAFPISACTLAATGSLHFGQILMHELHDHRALANARGYTFHGAMPYVANYKDARNICF